MIPYEDLFIALARAKIKYLVAGGVAVNLHQVQRATADLDLIVHLKPNNLRRFILVMKRLGYKPRLPVPPQEFADPKIRKEWMERKNMKVFSFLNPKNPFEMIDIFVKEPKPFGQLTKNKLAVKAFGVTIPVVGLSDLMEMKKKAGRDTDLFDVEQLRKLRS